MYALQGQKCISDALHPSSANAVQIAYTNKNSRKTDYSGLILKAKKHKS